MSGPVQGIFTKVGTGTTGGSMDKRYEVLDCTLGRTTELVTAPGLYGTRDEPKERTREGPIRVGGTITMCPNVAELTDFLPLIFGGASSVDDALGDKDYYVDKVEEVYRYTAGKIDVARFTATKGGMLQMAMDIVAKTETTASFGNQSINIATGPFMLQDLVLSIGGTSYEIFNFSLECNNFLDRERFTNSQTLSQISTQGRQITLTVDPPWGDQDALYGLTVTGVAVVATFTQNGHVFAITMPAVQFPKNSPLITGRNELVLPLVGVAKKSSSTASLSWTLS